MAERAPHTVEMIPVDRITVLNSRVRHKAVFQQVVSSVSELGLKRPITVTRRASDDGEPRYNLVCGQGRLEAYVALGQTMIPALVVEASEEECLLMSLVENMARRKHTPMELVQDIRGLRERGYSYTDIARKTGLDAEYVSGVVDLLEQGEERLVAGVEAGTIPISVAAHIARAGGDAAVQHALQDAYERGQLRGRRLIAARRLIEQRRRRGKSLFRYPRQPGRTLSSEGLVRAYQQEAERQRLMIKKAELAQSRLLFVTSALQRLLADEHFVTLLRAENLGTMPRYLADRVQAREGTRA